MLYDLIDGKVIVTASTGKRVQCNGVFALLMQAGSALPVPAEPQPPTYEIVGLGDEKQRVPHTAESIKEKATDAERTAWQEYLADRAAYDRGISERDTKIARLRTNVLIDRGIVVIDLPDLDGWADAVLNRYGIAVSEDPDERMRQYVNMEIAPTQEDMYKLTLGIAAASGLSEEVLSRVEDMFRDSMGRPKG